MSYQLYTVECPQCHKVMATWFGIVGTTQVADPVRVCPDCGCTDLRKVADGWNYLQPIPTVTTVPFKCPVCNGTGIVSRPPWVAGDVTNWSASICSYLCLTCKGAGILWGIPANAADLPQNGLPYDAVDVVIGPGGELKYESVMEAGKRVLRIYTGNGTDDAPPTAIPIRVAQGHSLWRIESEVK